MFLSLHLRFPSNSLIQLNPYGTSLCLKKRFYSGLFWSLWVLLDLFCHQVILNPSSVYWFWMFTWVKFPNHSLNGKRLLSGIEDGRQLILNQNMQPIYFALWIITYTKSKAKLHRSWCAQGTKEHSTSIVFIRFNTII